MQQAPGHWYFVPEQPVQPIRDTRFIRNGWEWLLFLADCAAIGLVLLYVIGNVLQASGR